MGRWGFEWDLTGNIKDKWSLFSFLVCCSSGTECRMRKTSLQGNVSTAYKIEYLFNRQYKDVISRETDSVFVRMPVDNSLFTSQTTLSPWLSATCREHSNNFDPTTGLISTKVRVCVRWRHKDISAEGMVIHLFGEWEINPCCVYLWPLFHPEAFQNKSTSSWSFKDTGCESTEESVCLFQSSY